MFNLAPTLMADDRPTTKNVLAYTASAGESGYAYFNRPPSQTLAFVNDGSMANNNWQGVIKESGGTAGQLWIVATFPTETYLNEIRVWTGQFNGYFNAPRVLRVYRGVGTSVPLLNAGGSFNLNTAPNGASPPLTTFDLIGNSNFDAPSTQYLFRFSNSSSSFVSVNELELRG